MWIAIYILLAFIAGMATSTILLIFYICRDMDYRTMNVEINCDRCMGLVLRVRKADVVRDFSVHEGKLICHDCIEDEVIKG